MFLYITTPPEHNRIKKKHFKIKRKFTVAHFLQKIHFPKELSVLLDKLQTKSFFFFQKHLLFETKISTQYSVTWTPLLVLIL